MAANNDTGRDDTGPRMIHQPAFPFQNPNCASCAALRQGLREAVEWIDSETYTRNGEHWLVTKLRALLPPEAPR